MNLVDISNLWQTKGHTGRIRNNIQVVKIQVRVNSLKKIFFAVQKKLEWPWESTYYILNIPCKYGTSMCEIQTATNFSEWTVLHN